MKYRLLGQTDLYVSELCLGAMTFGAQGFWEAMSGLKQEAVNELVRVAYEGGINFFDTANVYSMLREAIGNFVGAGLSESFYEKVLHQ
jgi:aryl-alcohol dehydrogenase-like predicted oxidoreductase